MICKHCNKEIEQIVDATVEVMAAAPRTQGNEPNFQDQYCGDWDAPNRDRITRDLIDAVRQRDYDKVDATVRSIAAQPQPAPQTSFIMKPFTHKPGCPRFSGVGECDCFEPSAHNSGE